PESPNDFAMMHEVITRRLKAYVEGDKKFSRLPDLIVIDGGKGQLAAALKARDELGLVVPMAGLAKRMEVLFAPSEPLPLAGMVRAREGEGAGVGGSAALADRGSRIADLMASLNGESI